MTKPSQLLLLSDHIKLSLLERQRATSLNLENDTQDGHISRSLDQFRAGLATLTDERARLESNGDQESAAAISSELPNLQKQFDDLTAQFHGFVTASNEATLNSPNASELAEDFAHAASRGTKSVRFSDTSTSSPEAALFGDRYRDDPSQDSGYRDQAEEMSNQQIHEYHTQVMDQQDEQLDRLGESISRQRELSMQIGDELDSHVTMLDEVDAVTDRHQTRLDRAKRTLGKVAKGAGENKQMTAIVVLIIILVLLIAILK